MKEENMASVGIVMGSDSDLQIMAKAAEVLDDLGISYEMNVISAHREPQEFFNYANSAEKRGYKVIIAGAGMAAHLPGMCAAIFPMPFPSGRRFSVSEAMIWIPLPGPPWFIRMVFRSLPAASGGRTALSGLGRLAFFRPSGAAGWVI